MSRRRILVIEDDAAIRQVVVDALEDEGFEALEAGTYASGLRLGVQVPCDLVLLDLVLPGGDGLDLLAEVRKARPTVPVIVSTARGEETDRIRGLKLGADDYVVKPFSLKEMLARVEAVLRRSAERPAEVTRVSFRGGVADLDAARLRFDDGVAVQLSEREAVLLRYLAQNAGRTVTRDELLERVWNVPAHQVRTRIVDMTVARLREKLRDGGDGPAIIRTLRGRGYRFEAP